MKELAIVILNYNGKKLLQQFLPSVISHSDEASVYVIDNKSEDDSIDWLETHYNDQLTIIPLAKNHGFAGGYNEGLKRVNEPYWCLLNSDVRVTENYTVRPLELLRENANIAAVQPKIKSERHPDFLEYAGAAGGFLDYLGYPFCRGRLFQYIEKDNGQYDDEIEVFWTTGACMFIKRSAFENVGGFDSAYFAHQEEIDLCWRLHHKGLKFLYTSKSTVYHLGGSTLTNQNPFKTYLNFRNSLFTLVKNLLAFELPLIVLNRLVLDGIAGIVFLFQGKPKHTFAILKAHFNFYFALPRLMKQRRSIQPKYRTRKPLSIVIQHFVLNRKKILKF